MKIKYLIGTLGLSLALGLGVGAGLSANKGEAREAKAATSKTFYLDCTGHDWDTYDSICLHLYGSTPGDKYYQALQAGDNYWYVTIPDIEGFSGAEFYKCNSVTADHSSATNLYWKQSWLSFPSSNYYYTVVSDSYADDNKNWSAPVTTFTVSGTHADTSSISETLTSYKFDSSGLQSYSTSLHLTAGDVFTASNGTVTTNFSDLRSYKGQSANEKGYVVDDGNGNIKVVETGDYEFYINAVTGSAWLQGGSQQEASAWAKDFVEGLGCSGTAKPANWDVYATGAKKWSNLTNGAKYLFVSVTADNAENASYIAKAAFMHDMCVAKANAGDTNYEGCTVFMTYEGGSRMSSGLAAIQNPMVSNSSNSAITSIVIIATVSMLAAGGFFLLKKKKSI